MTVDENRIAHCVCGWSGVPNRRGGQVLCPCCQADEWPAPAGRNDPCPCGSARKFKRCCGA